MSYSVGSPIVVGDRMYLHGTRSVQQASTDWPALVLGHKVPEQRLAERLAANSNSRVFVGHSLGASWALKLASRFNGVYRGYGRPGLGHTVGDEANFGDPVSFLQFHPTRLALGHSLSSYA